MAGFSSALGLSPEEVQQQIDVQDEAAVNNAPQTVMGAFAHLGAQSGQALGKAVGALGGFKDPRIQRAQALQDAQQEVQAQGIDLLTKPQDYYRATYQALAQRGLMGEAAHVADIAQQHDALAAETALKNAQAQADLSKAPYIPLGKGGALDTTTKQVIGQSPADTSKAVLTLAPAGSQTKGLGTERTFILSDPTQAATAKDLMAQGYVDTSKLPGPERTSPLERLVANNTAANLEALKEISMAKEVGKKSADFTATYQDEIAKKASTAAQIQAQLKADEEASSSGNTEFGPLIDKRAYGVGLISVFAPKLEDTAKELLKVDPTDYQAVTRASNNITLQLASQLNGGRMTNMLLHTLKEAGPATFMTNEGKAVVRTLMDKETQKDMDRFKYLMSLPEDQRNRMSGTQWDVAHATDPKYSLTSQDIQQNAALVKKAKIIKNLWEHAIPLRPGTQKIDGRTYIKQGASGPEFARYDQSTNTYIPLGQ